MKKPAPFIFVLVIAAVLIATRVYFKTQFHSAKKEAPVITYADAPPIGYGITAIKLAQNITPGAGGADLVWDFSSINASGKLYDTSGYLKVLNHSTSAGGNTTTDSGLCLEGRKDTMLSYFYYTLTSTLFADTIVSLPGREIIWPVTKPELKFPFHYGETLIKPCQKLGKSLHNDTVIYDGYGTIKTPFGTFTNVVRLHFIDGHGEPNYEWWTSHPFFALVCYTPSGGMRFYIPADKQK